MLGNMKEYFKIVLGVTIVLLLGVLFVAPVFLLHHFLGVNAKFIYIPYFILTISGIIYYLERKIPK